MRLIAILSWYDEQPAWLAGVIASLAKADVEHLVAVDGAYALYPEGLPYSGAQQHNTIMETCAGLQMGCTISTPQEVWWGNEVEKRSHAFAVAETIATPNEDWYLIIDADHFLTSALGLRKRLEETDADAGECKFWERYGPYGDGACPLRCFYRAIPGLRHDGAHYIYRTPDGRDLHGAGINVVDLSMVEIEHRTMQRFDDRKDRQKRYYQRRDELGIENVAVA